MSLTNAQLQALKADILANPDLASLPNDSDGNFEVARLYNLAASPAWTIWRTSVSAQQVMENDFVWTAVDGLTNGKARIWDWMTRYGTFNPSKANVRRGLADAFGNPSAMVTAILPHCKTLATRVQKLFSTGTGSGATPATLAANLPDSYRVSPQEVAEARNLP